MLQARQHEAQSESCHEATDSTALNEGVEGRVWAGHLIMKGLGLTRVVPSVCTQRRTDSYTAAALAAAWDQQSE